MLPREDAKISVFDSAVQGGDAVWEGLRVYNGKIFQLDAHLDRLFDSAKAMAFADIPSRKAIKTAIFETLKANNMRDEVHIRLTLTRGEKTSSGMSPHFNQYGSCLIVLPEWKPPVYPLKASPPSPLRSRNPLCHRLQNPPQTICHNILAKITANVPVLMTRFTCSTFGLRIRTKHQYLLHKKGALITPHADSCLPGITRSVVIDLARDLDIEVTERNLSLTEVYTADEGFTTGTMGELSPILEADGRTIGNGKPGPITNHLREQYAQHTAEQGEPIP